MLHFLHMSTYFDIRHMKSLFFFLSRFMPMSPPQLLQTLQSRLLQNYPCVNILGESKVICLIFFSFTVKINWIFTFPDKQFLRYVNTTKTYTQISYIYNYLKATDYQVGSVQKMIFFVLFSRHPYIFLALTIPKSLFTTTDP